MSEMKSFSAPELTGVIAILREVDSLLTPKSWIKFSEAEDSEGNPVSAIDERACKWCLTGALRKICSSRDHELYTMAARIYLARSVGSESIPYFNDAKKIKFKDVRRVIRSCIRDGTKRLKVIKDT